MNILDLSIILQMPMMGGGVGFYVMLAFFGGLSWLAGHMLKKRFNEHSQVPFPLTGAQVAQKMLKENGCGDVQVVSTPGRLTDHYNPADRTVNLSEAVYQQSNVAAAAVAAHECGHAVQHATSYAPLKARSAIVPAVSIGSKFTPILLMVGIMIMASSGSTLVLGLGVLTMAISTLFSFVTLPVEFDASKRAMVWIRESGLSSNVDSDRAKNALFWAAMTYVVAALAALGQLLYFASMLLGRRN